MLLIYDDLLFGFGLLYVVVCFLGEVIFLVFSFVLCVCCWVCFVFLWVGRGLVGLFSIMWALF